MKVFNEVEGIGQKVLSNYRAVDENLVWKLLLHLSSNHSLSWFKIWKELIWSNLSEVLRILGIVTFNFPLRKAILNFIWKRVILG